MTRPSKPARPAQAGVARLTAVGGASALPCLGAALVAPAASATPASSVVNSAAFVAGDPCDSNRCGRQPPFVYCGANTQACANGKHGPRSIPPARPRSSSESTEA